MLAHPWQPTVPSGGAKRDDFASHPAMGTWDDAGSRADGGDWGTQEEGGEGYARG